MSFQETASSASRLAALALCSAFVWFAHARAANAPSAADQVVARYFRNDGPGFTVGVFLHGEPLYLRGVGDAVIEHSIRNSEDTVYCVGSVSKQFTAFAAQLMIAEGRLTLETDVRTLLNEHSWRPAPLRVKHLLYHTSGLKDVWWIFGPAGLWEGDALEQIHFSRLAGRIGYNFPTGTDASYSNTGYHILADVVTAAAGVPVSQLLGERVFRPLGMSRTLMLDSVGTIVPGQASSYQRGWKGGHLMPKDDSLRKVPLGYAAHGTTNVRASVSDLGKWLGNLVRPVSGHATAAAAMVHMGALDDGSPINYGSGLRQEVIAGNVMLAHIGHDQEFYTALAVSTATGLAVVVAANVEYPVKKIRDELIALYTGVQVSSVSKPQASASLANSRAQTAAIGVYRGPGGRAVRILSSGKGLVLEDTTTLADEGVDARRLWLARDGSFRLSDPENGAQGKLSGERNGHFVELHFPIPQDSGLGRSVLERTLVYRRDIGIAQQSESDVGLAGTYWSRELDAMVRIRAAHGGYTIEHNRDRAPRPMFRWAPKLYWVPWLGAHLLTFDPGETPTGFVLANPEAADIRFDRLPEGFLGDG